VSELREETEVLVRYLVPGEMSHAEAVAIVRDHLYADGDLLAFGERERLDFLVVEFGPEEVEL